MTQRTEIVWLLVRSNPFKKDSVHYVEGEAEELQKHLAQSRTGTTGKVREAELTSVVTLEIDRDTCAVAVVRS